MSLISVDEAMCCRDGACVEVCPLGLISREDEATPPFMSAANQEFCVRCGHCVAVCSTQAMSHTACPTSECDALPDGWRLDPNRIERFLKGRRSIRRYKQATVPQTTIERLIDIARYAPTGQNAQSVSWLVLYNPEEVRSLAGSIVVWLRELMKQQPLMARALHVSWYLECWERGMDTVLRGAPHVVIAHGPKGDELSRLGSLLSMAHFELAAQAHGLGACWSGYTTMLPGVEELLGLPSDHQAFAAMLVGFSQHEYRRIPRRRAAQLTWRL